METIMIGTTKQVLERLAEPALVLKLFFETSLEGTRHPGFDTPGSGPSVFQELVLPPDILDIGKSELWECRMKVLNSTKCWSIGLSSLIAAEKRLSLFRAAFQGTPFEFEHAMGILYHEDTAPPSKKHLFSEPFASSAKTVTVSPGNPVVVHPIDAHPLWVNARLFSTDRLADETYPNPLIGCEVDPFDFRERPATVNHYQLVEPHYLQTFYIKVTESTNQKEASVQPVARAIAYDTKTKSVTFVLDKNVTITD